MTTASKITLVRVALIPVYMVLMYLSKGVPGGFLWGALAVFIAASLTDFVDGQIARRCNQVSDFGKFLDPLADKLLVIAAMVIFCEWGKMPAWAVMIVLTREFAVTGLRLVAVGNMLMESIKRSKGRDNKSLARFADQLRQLLEKWES